MVTLDLEESGIRIRWRFYRYALVMLSKCFATKKIETFMKIDKFPLILN